VAGPNGAVVRRLHLGRILRELREQAGLSLEVAAPSFDWSSSKLSRIENGRQGVDVHGVRTMMDVYGVVGPQWEELLDLTRAASEKGWWRAYGLDDKGYVPLEAEATLVREANRCLRSRTAADRCVRARPSSQARCTADPRPSWST
jgi:transcriptional regulator with XRE-family HTH domain